MSSKSYYNESYRYHDSWCNFLVEQGPPGDDVAQAQMQAQQAAEEERMKQEALLGLGQGAGQLFSIIEKLGAENINLAKKAISGLSRELNDLATREDNVETFIEDITRVINGAATDLGRQQK